MPEEIEFTLPEGVSKEDLLRFLEHLRNPRHGGNPSPKGKVKCSCQNCSHWEPKSPIPCKLFSAECVGNVTKGKLPVDWYPTPEPK